VSNSLQTPTRLYDLCELSVLVVDDNARMRALVVNILEALNLTQVIPVGDGPEALTALDAAYFDLIIVDWMMDGMDGLALARRIRSGEGGPGAGPHVPIILMTANTDPGFMAKARDAGVNEMLTKPITAERLYRRIVTIIENPRPYIVSPGYVGPCRRRHDDHDHVGPERRSGGVCERSSVAIPNGTSGA
jgi:CheY-like chemotaxis protein